MKKLICIIPALFFLGCGVKGDPIPPRSGRDLGRGQPTYKGATKELKIQVVPDIEEESLEKDK